MKTRQLLALLTTLCFFVFVDAQKLDESLFDNIKPRNIGPAGMSGRVTAIDVVLDNPDIMYIGAAAGGVWRTENGGHTWTPIFDHEKTSSIGDIAIYQENPNIIYVGTGEGNPRNSANSGVGMYKTTDGGRTWQHIGLENTRQIHRVIVHPEDPNIVWAGAMGSAWAPNPERGVYKSIDGGKTWNHVLTVNDTTGVADLRIDPSNPNRLICAMWHHLREPWFFKSGGEGSAMYVSNDGGDSWEQIKCDSGLPCGELGRIGVAFAPSNPEVVYAYIESKENAIYRSDDGGYTWKRKSKSKQDIGGRPFYYADIYVDVKNENRLYSIATEVTTSDDAGATWQVFAAGNRVHTDHHAWWAHPENPDHLINGNDGGLFYTNDRGEKWYFVENLPLAQFYHMRVDMEVPYNVYGGLQDNGSWCGPSQSWFKGGIRNMYWQRLSVGDGFDVVPDPQDHNYGYAMGQAGNLVRYHKPSGLLQPIKPIHPDGEYLRFNWNAGIAINPHDELTIYYGSQYVHRSSDYGRTWDIISPDLTTNDSAKQEFLETGGLTYDVTGAEFHCTIVSIAPSPMDENVIWVGTDDGNVQITKNGGSSWEKVNIAEVPSGAWVTHIHPSQYQVGEAWVVIDDHRRNNWEPYIYHTSNYGASWTRVVTSDDVDGFAYTFVQDPEQSDLWFCGTDVGLYFSIDAGANWNRWTSGFPTTPVTDLAIHPRDGDLIIATFGRSFWILDDIRPLREMASDATALDNDMTAFSCPDAILAAVGESHGYRDGKVGDVLYNGENRPYGSLITYYVSEIEGESDTVEIEIFNAAGASVRNLRQVIKSPGIQRVNWDLRRNAPRFPNQKKPERPSYRGGAEVPPGAFFVTVKVREESARTSVVVIPDPRLSRTAQDFATKDAMIKEVGALVEQATAAADEIRSYEESLRWIKSRADASEIDLDEELIKGFESALGEHKEQLVGRSVQGIYRQPDVINNMLRQASYRLDILVPVTSTERRMMQQLTRAVNDYTNNWDQFKSEWIPKVKSEVERSGVSMF